MGTRGSPLALAQSRQVAAALQQAHPGLQVEERIIRTTGDRQQGQPLPAIGGKGVFTLEIEQALLGGEIDFAVHSLKDLPPDSPPGLCIGAIPQRASAADVGVLSSRLRRVTQQQQSNSVQWPELPPRARVGTSSLRRRAQLLHGRPDLQVEDIRGNVGTRLRKLDEENFDAIVLAEAGLQRLGLLDGGSLLFPLLNLGEEEFLPAPGQGALALEARAGDWAVLDCLQRLEDAATRAAVTAERAVVRGLEAGCTTPLGTRTVVKLDEGHLALQAVVLSPDGRNRVAANGSGRFDQAEAIGQSIAEKLVQRGARELIAFNES